MPSELVPARSARPMWTLAAVIATVSLLAGFVSVTSAQEVPPRVMGFERFHAGEGANPLAAGHLLIGELNCTSCHQADASLASVVLRKPAPVLDSVGNRVRPQYLLKFLADPQTTKPSTTMPNVLAGMPEAERTATVEAIVHFLATTGTFAETAAMRQSVNRGEKLFHSIGCIACHDARTEAPKPEALATSLPLGTPSRKYTLPGLTQFLSDPLAVRPGGRMPHLIDNATEARDLASFLLKDLEVSSGLQYAVYEGSWDKLPDFSKLEPKELGDCDDFTVDVTKRKDHFGIRFDGQINIPTDGDYLFLIHSDDGSRLTIDGKVLIDNDGIHPPQQRRKQQKMKAGVHSVVVEYFEQGGGEELKVEFQGPNQPQQNLAAIVVATSKKPAQPAAAPFVVDSQKAAKGRELFTKVGCASCHDLKIDGQKLASSFVAKKLIDLKDSGGCLTNQPGKLAKYNLGAKQVAAISSAIKALHMTEESVKVGDAELVTRQMTRLNCFACHQRGTLGGIEDKRNPHFKSDMPEMGDEGRLPPHLTSVGAKLRVDWLGKVFDQSPKVRSYMFTRMPRFGLPNVETLAKQIVAVDVAKEVAKPNWNVDEQDKRTKATGRRIVGAQGFSCIKCHTFADKKATGIQALSLTTMTQRLRPEWFHNYMFNPATYRPGTRMPSPFQEGKSLLRNVLGGDPNQQLGAIWAFLKDGEQAQLPDGLVTGKMELVAFDDAIMYRNFIEGAGPRAIGVGYPEKLNLAYDANQLRLALLWHGGFMDASRHWNGRGAGFEQPLGDRVWKQIDGVPLAVLADDKAPWPNQPPKEQGYQFRGYRLGDKMVPTFMYSFKDLKADDVTSVVGDGDLYVLQRTLTLEGASESPANLFWRLAAGNVEPAEKSTDTFKVDGDKLIRVKASAAAKIREQGGRKELLVPIQFKNGKAQVIVDYEW